MNADYLIGSDLYGDDLVGESFSPAPTLAAVRAGLASVKRGHEGPAVLYVQGVAGSIADSKFGEKTEAAVRKFQAARGLTSNGVVNKATLDAMDKLAGGTGSATVLDLTAIPDDASLFQADPPPAAAPPVAQAPTTSPVPSKARVAVPYVFAAIAVASLSGAAWKAVHR